MKYPKRSPYLSFKRTEKDKYIIKDFLYSDAYQANAQTAAFLKQLDGKHNPYDLLPELSKADVRQAISHLDDCNLLAPKKKFLKLGLGHYMYPLIYCYPNKLHKRLAALWNFLLMIMCIPMLALGLYIQANVKSQIYWQSKSELYMAMLLGIVLGIIIHELSHTCSGLTYNGRLYEIGIGTRFFLPMGYVLLDDDPIKNHFHKIQFFAAGIEANILLYGIFMCLASNGFGSPIIMYLAGIENLGLAIANILPLDGLDGMKILSTVFRKDDLLQHAKKLVKKNSSNGVHVSLRRTICISASYALIVFQMVLPLLVIYNGYSLIRLIAL